MPTEVLIGKRALEVRVDAMKIGARGRERGAGCEASDRAGVAPIAVRFIGCRRRKRNPHVAAIGEIEVRWHHADDRICPPIDGDRLPDKSLLRSETAAPQTIA